jgi:ribonuclease D
MRDFGLRFAGLFDTMIAARFLGLSGVGLQALARSELGIELSKDSQKDDWSRRPLTPVQEAYALADVRHLIDLQRRLAERLREKGRLDWVLEECEGVAGLEAARRRRDPDAFLAIKGAGHLSRRGLAVLRELHTWRERMAEATDRPPFKILPNETLLGLAAHPPRSASELARGRLPARLKAQAPALFEAVARAQAAPEPDLPYPPVHERPTLPPLVRRRIEALRAWRTVEAACLELDWTCRSCFPSGCWNAWPRLPPPTRRRSKPSTGCAAGGHATSALPCSPRSPTRQTRRRGYHNNLGQSLV